MVAFLKIRLNLLIRALHLAGWGYLLVAILACSGVILSFFGSVMASPTPEWGLAFSLPTLLWHYYRQDKRLLHHLHLPIKPILWAEYGFGSIPAAILLIFSKNWLGLAVLVACIAAIPFIPFSSKANQDLSKKITLNWIPVWAFEWKSGIRRMSWVGILLWWGSLIGSWWIGTLPLFAFLYGTAIMSFYEDVEPKEILIQTFEVKYGLLKKIGQHMVLANLLIAPQAVIFIIFNVQYWYFLLAIVVFVSMVTCFSLASKYAGWYPRRQKVAQSILSGLFVLCTVSAIFTPVALGWVGWKTWVAHQNMQRWFPYKTVSNLT